MSCLRAESILIERIPGQSTVGSKCQIRIARRLHFATSSSAGVQPFAFQAHDAAGQRSNRQNSRGRFDADAALAHRRLDRTGKSVSINSLLMGMLYKATPEELKLVLVDPKQVELGISSDIPHLLTPVVTDAKVAANVLRNATREMERRLKMWRARRAKYRAVQPDI